MSVQHKDYTSKKTGKTIRKYYAAVYDAKTQKTITGNYHLKKSEAEDEETDIRRAIAAGTVQKRKAGQSFELVAQTWLESSAPPVYASNTWHGYKYYCDHYLIPVFGDRPINKITPMHIQKYVNIIKEKYSAETVNKCISALSNIFKFAIHPLEEISTNPAAGIKRAKVKAPKFDTWDDDTIQYFLSLDSVLNSWYYPMLCISLILGPRPSEVCGLEESSLSDHMLSLGRGYDKYKHTTDMKTTGSHRLLPLPDDLYKIIRRRLLWKKEKRLADNNFSENDFLFVSQKGKPINPDQYSKAFRRLIRAHNKKMSLYAEQNQNNLPTGHRMLTEISLYGCRHSFATNALAKGNNDKLVSSIMGNSVKTLLSRYVHPNDEQKLELIRTNAEIALSKNISNNQ